MATAKIAITIDRMRVKQIDALVEKKVFPNRSRAIQEAVSEKLIKLNRSRLAKESAKLDKHFEQTMAEEGISSEVSSWLEY